MIPKLHFDGPVWRPPYEATSQLLQVTAGCTWHRCKFCTLYGEQRFRLSPINEIESDLRMISKFQPRANRIFLTGANPFVLTAGKLADIALLVRKYIRGSQPTIGCFARITDIRDKSVDDLLLLRQLGYDFITIGVESGDSETLIRVNKGYMAEDIIKQCRKLEHAGIRYNFFYLTGLAGAGEGIRNATRSATVFNRLHPVSICVLSLTLFPESDLYEEMNDGLFKEATEHERFDEIICLIDNLQCNTHILGRTVSNPIPFTGYLPNDRRALIKTLSDAKSMLSEEQLRTYRDGIVTL
ncbi:MAG: radical SAM protein [Bacteroidales bacterium]|nr:radical SAM protein [Bacteroidales bacterium]MCM1147456.1 radical SAM protein [Bacteroidales bacterium]MCM1206125.1 radical SAM protein [Bacillota bacterium]MCM1510044.1 radical SAM protein [Clostridium sp.]